MFSIFTVISVLGVCVRACVCAFLCSVFSCLHVCVCFCAGC